MTRLEPLDQNSGHFFNNLQSNPRVLPAIPFRERSRQHYADRRWNAEGDMAADYACLGRHVDFNLLKHFGVSQSPILPAIPLHSYSPFPVSFYTQLAIGKPIKKSGPNQIRQASLQHIFSPGYPWDPGL